MSDKPSGRIASYREALSDQDTSELEITPLLSTGAVYKYSVDLKGKELVLPKRLHGNVDYFVQVFDKKTGEMVLFEMLERHSDKMVWKRWKATGVVFDSSPPIAPGEWEGYVLPEGKYRAVIMW